MERNQQLELLQKYYPYLFFKGKPGSQQSEPSFLGTKKLATWATSFEIPQSFWLRFGLGGNPQSFKEI